MTIDEARLLLKEDISHLSDEEVLEMIARDKQVVHALFGVFEKSLTDHKNYINNGVKA